MWSHPPFVLLILFLRELVLNDLDYDWNHNNKDNTVSAFEATYQVDIG